jgi:hypothetical protein
VLAAGCGAREANRYARTEFPENNLKQIGLAMHGYENATPTVTAFRTPSDKQDETAKAAQSPERPAVPTRRIIYDATIDMVVDSLSVAERAIRTLIKEHGGFLAESDQSSQTSDQRRAKWRVRVPVDRFDSFVAGVSRLGEVRLSHIGSQDVTEEYFDIQARIRNKQEEEKRLLKHLAESTGQIKDILEVERELSRVRGEVEQMQGRLRFLSDRTELSTVTIDATEWKEYTPPVAATFPTQIARTFFGSVDYLASFGKSLTLVFAALVPWLPLIVVVLFAARWLVRRAQWSSARGSFAAAPPSPRAP